MPSDPPCVPFFLCPPPLCTCVLALATQSSSVNLQIPQQCFSFQVIFQIMEWKVLFPIKGISGTRKPTGQKGNPRVRRHPGTRLEAAYWGDGKQGLWSQAELGLSSGSVLRAVWLWVFMYMKGTTIRLDSEVALKIKMIVFVKHLIMCEGQTLAWGLWVRALEVDRPRA